MTSSRKTSPRPHGSGSHRIRIIGGLYKRTPIPVLDAASLRPTPDRVRETLFNWLHHWWQGDYTNKAVADVFAGTGALGLEAASRGVGAVTLIEMQAAAVRALRQIAAKLGADQVAIRQDDALKWLARQPANSFDLIFLDPPFGQDWLARALPAASGPLKPEGLLYVEAEQPIPEIKGFTLLRQDRAGTVHFHLFQKDKPAA